MDPMLILARIATGTRLREPTDALGLNSPVVKSAVRHPAAERRRRISERAIEGRLGFPARPPKPHDQPVAALKLADRIGGRPVQHLCCSSMPQATAPSRQHEGKTRRGGEAGQRPASPLRGDARVAFQM